MTDIELNDSVLKKRSFILSELYETEIEYEADLHALVFEFLPKLRQDEEIRGTSFMCEVFQNVHEILPIHKKFLGKLKHEFTSIDADELGILDLSHLLLDLSTSLEPYVLYCSYTIHAKATLEREVSRNPHISLLLEDIQNCKLSRKLPLTSFLSRPLSRPPRYLLIFNLLLETYTPKTAEHQRLLSAIQSLKALLDQIDNETGQVTNSFYLNQLQVGLQSSSIGSYTPSNLDLINPSRKLIRQGNIEYFEDDKWIPVLIVLLDNYLLLLRKIQENSEARYYLLREVSPRWLDISTHEVLKPLDPREFTVLAASEFFSMQKIPKSEAASPIFQDPEASVSSLSTESTCSSPAHKKRLLTPLSRHSSSKSLNLDDMGHYVVIVQCSKIPEALILSFPSSIEMRVWSTLLTELATSVQTHVLFHVYDPNLLWPSDYLASPILCSAVYEKNYLILGTHVGLFCTILRSNMNDIRGSFDLMLEAPDVSTIQIISKSRLLLFQSAKTLCSLQLPPGPSSLPSIFNKATIRKFSKNISFFNVGSLFGEPLVVAVKSRRASATLKIFKVVLIPVAKLKRNACHGEGFYSSLRLVKRIYIGSTVTDVIFCSDKLLVSCRHGLEIVDIESYKTQELLDPLHFSTDCSACPVKQPPVALFSIEKNIFLICFKECGFFIDKHGWRARLQHRFDWKGCPHLFVVKYPYILAFSKTFVELWNIVDCVFLHVTPLCAKRFLTANFPLVTIVPLDWNVFHTPDDSQAYKIIIIEEEIEQ